MWDFRSERADLTMKDGYSAWIEGRTQTVLGEGIGKRRSFRWQCEWAQLHGISQVNHDLEERCSFGGLMDQAGPC